MCGLVGVAGKLEFKDEALMKRLLVYDYFRGTDSTGFASLKSHDKSVRVAKLAAGPIELFDMKAFTEALSGYTSSVFLGHNRAATKGAVNRYNAHPYQFDHITCAHNGTLEQSSWKAIEDRIGEKYETDSMAVAAAIAKIGIEETVPLLQGAWALVWIDTEQNTLNFLRNKERPFWYAYSENFDHLFWASEWQMIRAAVDLSGSQTPHKLYQDPEKGYSFWQTEVDWWYRYDLDVLKKGSTVKPTVYVKTLKGKEPIPVTTTYSGNSPFHRNTWTGGTPITTKTDKSGTTVTTGTDNVAFLSVSLTRNEGFGDYLSLNEFEQYAKYGCGFCQESVEYDDDGIQVFSNPGVVLCAKCSGGTEQPTRLWLPKEKIVASN